MDDRRFNAQSYLDVWAMTGTYPAIHAPLTAMVLRHLIKNPGERVMDLCCSTGLLTERLHRSGAAAYVMGVDGDADAIERGRKAGITAMIKHLAINCADPLPLMGTLLENGITVVVARRCIPELSGGKREAANMLAQTLHSVGVKNLFIQGRVSGTGRTNGLDSVHLEAAAMEPFWTTHWTGKAFAHMKAA